MNIGILGAGVVHPQDLAQFAVPPAWRKATRNMIMATKSMEQALLQVPMLMERRRSGLGMVVGSNSGELETSAEFLTTLSRAGIARPLLFQNSLHNATGGFASIHFGLTGPVFTTTEGDRTPTETVALAQMLLIENSCTAVIVTLLEVHKIMADYMSETVTEGACTLILGSESLACEMRATFHELGSIATPYEMEPKHLPLYDIDRSEFYRTARRLSGFKI